MMLANPVARVYAEALFQIAKERSVVDDVAQELQEFRALVDENPAIAEFLATPVIEPEAKVKQLKGALDGRASDVVTDFLCLLVEKHRFLAFGMIVDTYTALADELAGRVRVDVRSATPLPENLRTDLVSVLRESLGREIQVESETDPALMGGAVVTIGDKVWDGSLKTRLNRFRKQLVRS